MKKEGVEEKKKMKTTRRLLNLGFSFSGFGAKIHAPLWSPSKTKQRKKETKELQNLVTFHVWLKLQKHDRNKNNFSLRHWVQIIPGK